MDIDAYNGDSNDVLLELGTRYESDVNHFTTSVLQTTFDINDPEKDGDLDYKTLNSKIARIKSFLDDFETALKTGDYDTISQYMDVESFVDFYIVCELFKNADFNFSSTRFYIKNDKVYAGPLWDFDLSCGNLNPRSYQDYYDDGVSYKNYRCRKMTWYASLFESNWFERKVKNRFEELQYIIQNLYKTDTIEPLSIKFLTDNYGMSYKRDSKKKDLNGAGWPLNGGGGYIGISYATTAKWKTWEEPIEFLRDWMENRNIWMCDAWDIDMVKAYEESAPEEPTTEQTTVEPTTAEPTTDPTTEPTTVEPTTESTTETNTEPNTGSTTEPNTEVTTEPATAESTTVKQTTESTTEEPTTEPTTEQITEPYTEAGNVTNNQLTTEQISENNTAAADQTGNVSKRPKKTKIINAKKLKKRRIKVRLKKVTGVKGYQVKLAANKKFTRKVVIQNTKKPKFSIRVKARYKKCYIKARTYAKINGKIRYSKWCGIKVIKNIK